MKKLFVIASGFLLVPQANAQPAVLIAEYRFEIMPGGINTTIPYYVNNLVLSSASNFTPGTGLAGPVGHTQGASLTNSNDRAYWGSNWNTVFDANDYFGFTLTPAVGYTLVVDRLTFYERRSGTGPQNWQLRRNPYSSTITAGATTAGSASPVQTPFGFKNIPLALNSATTMGLRMYGYGSTDPAGTWRIDTVRVYGHLQNVFNLPIELISFTGHEDGDDVRLDWTTATETNNDYFTVYRLESDSTWSEVGRVAGAGNSQNTRSYSLMDSHPRIGTNYYKLRQTDLDGEHEEFNVIAVIWKPPDKTVAYPNPSDAGAPVYLLQDVQSVMVSDAAGRIIPSELSGKEIRFDGSPGKYFILLVSLYGGQETIEILRR